ncbi:hypothetical protein AC578_10433 [Pseudocercospora eumusae]|uniref:Replication protein A subunit n=1 Tax=Pseudocercospora eumusae TaxID=321146 RepID=A0A139H2H8_9PEZI|nr:hypothetical protein AC578_10433 [Pseudocercospora eumusae]
MTDPSNTPTPDEVSALFEGKKKKKKARSEEDDHQVTVQIQLNARYRVFDLSGNVPFSIVFGLVRKAFSDKDPRPLIIHTHRSVLDIPHALVKGMLTLHVHEGDREVPVDVSRLPHTQDNEGTSITLPSPLERTDNRRRCMTVYEYIIKPSSALGSLFEVGKRYSVRVHPAYQDTSFSSYEYLHQEEAVDRQQQVSEKPKALTTIAHGRALFRAISSVPVPPILQTRMRLWPSASSEEGEVPAQLEISVENTGSEPITVRTRGRQRFLVAQDPVFDAEGEAADDARPRMIDESSLAPASSLQIIDTTTAEKVWEAAKPGPCGGASNPKKTDDTRPKLETLATLKPGKPLSKQVVISQLLAKLPDGKYGVRMEPRGMWWCVGDRGDFANAGEERLPQHLWNTAILPAILECSLPSSTTTFDLAVALPPHTDYIPGDDNMTDAFNAITHGALRQITEGNPVENPILQCVQIKPMAQGAGGTERWRVVFNDTTNFIQGMLSSQSNHLITEGHLKKGSVCRLTQYQANFVKDKHILIIMNLDVLHEYGEQEKLGQPVALEAAKPEAQEDVKPQPGNIAGNNFYGQKPQQAQPQQQQRSLPSRTNGASHGGAHGNITPIEAVSPYQHKWTIKARCTSKGEIKTWHNKSSTGKLFSANFLDETSEIRATMFNEQCDQWYDVLQEGSVYYISTPCRVQLAKKQFSNLPNDYELTFERDTQVEKADDEGVPQVKYSFTNLESLQNVDKDTVTDVIGVLSEVGELNEIVSKTTSKPYSKRELTLVDDTGYNVRLTIWGKVAESFDASPEAVVAFKGVKVSDFGGRSLSLLSSGSMNIDPDIDEAFKLKGWYQANGSTTQFASHANTMATVGATSGGRKDDTKTIQQIRDENLGMTDDTDWFTLKATIVYIKQDNFAYPACQTTDPQPCNKKVNEENGAWRCEKCNKAWDAPKYRYIMSVNVSDHTGQMWLSCFDDVGQAVLGMPANELMAAKEEGDDKRVTDAFAEANCKSFVFKCRCKMDNYMDQQRVRYQVQYANNIDFVRESKKLADIIKLYNNASDTLFV